MELYISILKFLFLKEHFRKYQADVDRNFLRSNFPELLRVFTALEKAHEIETERDLRLVDVEAALYALYPKADRSIFAPLFAKLAEAPDEAKSIEHFLHVLRLRQAATQLAFAALDVGDGKAPLDSVTDLAQSFTRLASEQPSDTPEEEMFVDDDIDKLYEEAVAEPGLQWRLQTLRRSLGPLRKGDFGFIFARPETGKTTFLASEVTHFAGQTEKIILWFNNEEQDSKVLIRCYEAALGAPLEKIIANRPRAREYYTRYTGNRIKFPRGGCNSRRGIERLCERVQPSLIVIDQLDKVQGFEGEREDLRMGSIYAWARELAKQYAPVVGVSQSDGSGEGEKWLNMGNVANAKTAKQAEADWILGIGLAYTDPPNVRGFSICKNKLIGGTETVPHMRHGRFEVLIEPETARYRDIHKGE